MGKTEAAAKTVGEVEKLTGIPRRRVKYFIERGLFLPSGKSESGYWLYSNADLERLLLIALCKELDWPDRVLKSMLTDPEFPWLEELDRQISILAEKCSLCENKLLAARFLRARISAGAPPELGDLRREVLAILSGGAPETAKHGI